MASRENTATWIYTDADNTLWDTNSVYAEAQLGLLKRAEQIAGKRTPSPAPLEYLRQYDQGIARQHHSHLRYPPSLLIRALVKGLQGEPRETAVEHVLTYGAVPTEDEKCAVDTFQADLARVPPLLPSVQDGLRVAHDSGIPVYIVTEGPANVAHSRQVALGIERYTNGIHSATKTRELYLRLAEKAAPRRAVMIGDQPDRDIRLAHNAGLTTVLVAGHFRPAWLDKCDSDVADVEVRDFLSGIRWVIENPMPNMEGVRQL
jgi:putative hydrolase of the HAD superfamily